ncbi:hypothetical protein SFRURICE_015570 [Spodoptera frugiperda]|nr:hypothetical protein SFRURICE_015570 [Spodoptera frugiperda]
MYHQVLRAAMLYDSGRQAEGEADATCRAAAVKYLAGNEIVPGPALTVLYSRVLYSRGRRNVRPLAARRVQDKTMSGSGPLLYHLKMNTKEHIAPLDEDSGVRCQKTSPRCTLGTGNSPPNGGDRVGVAIACSELLDGAEGPEMGSKGGRLCADTWPAPPRERLSARLSDLAESVAERQGRKSHTRVLSWKASDSESDSSSVFAASVSSQRQTRAAFKRPRTEEGRGLSSSSNAQEAPAPPKIPTAARGGGRGKGKRLAVSARPKPAEHPAAEGDALISAVHSDSSVMEVVDAEGLKGERGSETLRQAVREGLRQIAGKKSQPAGAAQLKSVEAEIMAAAFDICRVPSAGKVHRELADMRRELTRLSASNAALEAELRATKAELAVCRGRQPQPPAEPDLVELLRREMAAFQQRFNVLESKLLRPPLAASSSATSRSYAAVAARPSTSSGRTSRGAQPVARPRAAPPTRTPAPPVVQAPAGGQAVNASTGRRRGRRGAAAQQAAPVTSEPTLPASGDWQVVGEARRVAKEARKRRKKAQRQRRQQQRKEKRAAALLLAPKTAAVVITLQPDAVQRGVTYGDVLAKLKGAVTPAEFGAPDGFLNEDPKQQFVDRLKGCSVREPNPRHDARQPQGTPPRCAPPCPLGGPRSDVTRAFTPAESDHCVFSGASHCVCVCVCVCRHISAVSSTSPHMKATCSLRRAPHAPLHTPPPNYRSPGTGPRAATN